ncbi:MAG: hypothetical protein GY717_10460 [Rhodobacteraceae bacterium]|nr:hypothetical protein [Paracoccaceae bacterium]
MTRLLTSTLAAAAIAMTGFTAAQAGSSTPTLSRSVDPGVASVIRGPVINMKISFTCAVNGTPVEFPNDIMIVNPHAFATDAGVKVAWATQNNAFSGVLTLPTLQPGQMHFVSNALPGGLPAGTPCSAQQI